MFMGYSHFRPEFEESRQQQFCFGARTGANQRTAFGQGELVVYSCGSRGGIPKLIQSSHQFSVNHRWAQTGHILANLSQQFLMPIFPGWKGLVKPPDYLFENSLKARIETLKIERG